MTSTLHKCVHCHAISIVYLCPRKTDPRTMYEYDCHTCESLNRFVPVKCIEQVGELPDRAVCAQPDVGCDTRTAVLHKIAVLRKINC